ncbi:zinc ribbon domain-containing protein [Paenibacillus sp. N1-5-1-14]|uniref:zinc ribbon domain-containing protein n=1 Tax=Paenibacillus radicibacter TaxID=2972488 RepID=UPI0021593250|nr:zinc ribbon domain-containing protein [Paenibacillus radicibacter]MCR8641574.1 zinc ribbon domain-containing protein [Paenibacillus radicibacter]
MSYLFGNGLIKCGECGGKYRGKKQRDKVVYICSTYNKDSSKCVRFVIEEKQLLTVLNSHLKLNEKKTGVDTSLYDLILYIEAKGGGYMIKYRDGKESIINLQNDYGIKVQF